MRLWSLHPKYLDAKGLVALWREALLAKKVFENKTKGYRNYPQLYRFRKSINPLDNINQYLAGVYEEALSRSYSFNRNKIDWDFKIEKLTVTKGQLEYEMNHLRKKLLQRNRKKLKEISKTNFLQPHPIFRVRKGVVEEWEVRTSEK